MSHLIILIILNMTKFNPIILLIPPNKHIFNLMIRIIIMCLLYRHLINNISHCHIPKLQLLRNSYLTLKLTIIKLAINNNLQFHIHILYIIKNQFRLEFSMNKISKNKKWGLIIIHLLNQRKMIWGVFTILIINLKVTRISSILNKLIKTQILF